MRKLSKYVLLIIIVLLISILMYGLFLKPGFNMSALNANNIYSDIYELSSSKYHGKLTGSIGNESSLNYIKTRFESVGLKPYSSDGSYFQSFETMVPLVDEEPVFTISDGQGSIGQSFTMYEDYSIITSHQGGSIDYDGELLLVGSNLLRIPVEEIENKIVVIVSGTLNPERIQYVMDHGGVGIFCSTDTENFSRDRVMEIQKNTSMEDKTGNTIVAGYISKQVYKNLTQIAKEDDDRYISGRIENVKLKIDISFSIVETANIIGEIQSGNDNGRVLILSANIDGLGRGIDGNYFPGALDNTSGISSLIEIARVLDEQELTSNDTIAFIGWNGQLQDLSGSSYYLNNPVYPLDKTTLIHIESIGAESVDGFKVSADRFNSHIHFSKFLQDGIDQQADLGVEPQSTGVINGFINESVPSLNLRDGNKWINTYYDSIDNIQVERLENGTNAILSYIRREVYKDNKVDFLNMTEILVIIIVLFIALINSTTYFLNKRYWNKKLFRYTYEEIYYSFPIRFIRDVSKTIFPYLVIIFMIVVLSNISSQTNIRKINGQWVTNFSPYLLFKKTVFYLRNMFNPDVHNSYAVGNVFDVIYDSSSKSLKLITSALGLSVLIGICKGLLDGMKAKKNRVSSLGTIIVFSIPDVLIVLIALLGYVFVAVNYPSVYDRIQLQEFILPLITLTIIPSIYISRITFITTQNELDKDYIKHARAIGMTKLRVFTSELFPAVLFTIVDTLPAIMTMLFTNMIIVEYLFNYNGITYYLLYLYNRNDVYRFVPLALSLGLIYNIFTYGISWIAKRINPLKREVKSK